MACAGVVASAGAQLDFTTFTVGTRNVTVGKSTVAYFGFNNSTSTGSLQNTTLEFANGTAYTCTVFEDEGTLFRLTFTGSPTDSDAAAFKRLIVGDQTFNRSDRASFGSGTYTFNSSDDVISAANGSTIALQLRAD
jgi:hypothetical protein